MDVKIGISKSTYPRHEHKFYEIIIFTSGSGIFFADEFKIPFSAGTIIVLPPCTPHELSSEGEFERMFINGDFSWILNNTTPITIEEGKNGDGTFLANLIYRNRYEKKDYLAALVTAFISYVLQNASVDDKIQSTIKTIANKITERFFDSEINPNEFLNESGYSEDYVRSKFKKIIGKTPIELLTETRISHACFLIDTYGKSLPLAIIAEKCGYTDYVYFSRRFKEIMKISPREYLNSLK